jgi:hypothetical protein
MKFIHLTKFGGNQIGVKGLKSYTGVTVNYPTSYTH